MTDFAGAVAAAGRRIRAHARETPIEPSPALAAGSGASVFLKCENLQHTGSFKARGALNKVLSLAPAELARGVVTASTGNHGAAVGFALRSVGARATVFVPERASPTKLAAIARQGGEIRRHGVDSGETEIFARAHAEATGAVWISPYNDPLVIGGQGTAGVELLRQVPDLDAVFVSLGGGGLIGGIGAWLKAHAPATRVIACSPVNSAVMMRSVEAGRILTLDSLPTLSDGTAGGVEPGSITFDLVRAVVDEHVAVDEDEIAAARRDTMEAHHMMVEGAAGVAVAGFRRQAARWSGARVAIVLCGANVSLSTLKSILP
jgi:threonine dehydratase